MDRLASTSSDSNGDKRPTSSSDEEDDPKPSFPELDKVLSASDQTLATYLTKTLRRVKQVRSSSSSSLPSLFLLTSPFTHSSTPT